MDLQKTIAGLEAQAAKYTEAANALRVLVEKTGDLSPASAPKAGPSRNAAVKSGASKVGKKDGRSKRGPVSQETRDKIAAAIKARHAQKKAQAQSEGQPQAQEEIQEPSA